MKDKLEIQEQVVFVLVVKGLTSLLWENMR